MMSPAETGISQAITLVPVTFTKRPSDTKPFVVVGKSGGAAERRTTSTFCTPAPASSGTRSPVISPLIGAANHRPRVSVVEGKVLLNAGSGARLTAEVLSIARPSQEPVGRPPTVMLPTSVAAPVLVFTV